MSTCNRPGCYALLETDMSMWMSGNTKPDLLTTLRSWSIDLRPLFSFSTDSVIVFVKLSFPRRNVVEKFREHLNLRLGTRLRERLSSMGDKWSNKLFKIAVIEDLTPSDEC